jgi:prepilin signal peptidase PulO-like enzyme (type II secretory pathway)
VYNVSNLVIDMFNIFTKMAKRRKKLNLKNKRLITTFLIGLPFVIYCGAMLLTKSHNYSFILNILIFIVLIACIYSFSYIASNDIFEMEIPVLPSVIIIIFLVLVNAILLLANSDGFVYIWNFNKFIPYNNLLAGIAFGIVIYLLVILTNGKGMGEGDILVAVMAGLILGYQNLIAAMYIIIFCALAYSFLVAIQKGSFHKVRIPFAPFILLGSLITLVFSNEISNFLLILK